MGHASISITLDRYGHLMPGNNEEAAGLLDAYLTAGRERVESAARQAEPAYSQMAVRGLQPAQWLSNRAWQG